LSILQFDPSLKSLWKSKRAIRVGEQGSLSAKQDPVLRIFCEPSEWPYNGEADLAT